MLDPAQIRDEVSAHVARLVGRAVEPAEPIISSRLLESIAAVRLVDFVENRFEIRVDDDELDLANFDSVEAISAFVEAKRGASR